MALLGHSSDKLPLHNIMQQILNISNNNKLN